MIVFDVAKKVLDTEKFPQHNIADLNSGISFIVLCSQEKHLRWKEISTHTHTHTHTRTHTHTHKDTQPAFICSKSAIDTTKQCVKSDLFKVNNKDNDVLLVSFLTVIFWHFTNWNRINKKSSKRVFFKTKIFWGKWREMHPVNMLNYVKLSIFFVTLKKHLYSLTFWSQNLEGFTMLLIYFSG